MGAAVSAIANALDNSKEKEAQAKEQLELMMKLADARLDTFESELKTMFLDRESAQKTSVPGRRALRFERHVQVDTETTPGKGVEDAVDAFFGASETGSKGVLEGFKSVVKTGLSAILGDSGAGESYDKKFFVCIKHNAIIRVDMYTYKYNFRNEGVISNHKNILAYILCISVVDHRDVTVDELIYLASEFAGDGNVGPNSGYELYLESLMKTWNALINVEVPGLNPGRRPIEYPSLTSRPQVAAA
ncbi:hypothetical protein B0T26DRAFT_800517 [Lasiosphaeria miniovina]|uniref:Uncharacterized protein n=2 Tax=Lasiosphaeria TaxID=92901 RepID=A0AA40B730_9PEZI|nr:uncharacterized protein B0T26DRAFT_800517 [Lasiosphaeria miniovina]KAK0728876.1 hypothetical protein B0T26DRAFT_800517 [Lasiosphaeria miniovina]KAK3373103.1 hypothetical protein B0T24DRAFT_678578 [Lasiosphaeria ovina]